jgi:hypothetical protein
MKSSDKTKVSSILAAAISVVGGFVIFLIDSSAGWDDTGITAGILFILAAVCGFLSPKRFWLWALLAGLWIPLNGFIKTQEFKYFLILLIPLAGSLAGIAAGGFKRKQKDRK